MLDLFARGGFDLDGDDLPRDMVKALEVCILFLVLNRHSLNFRRNSTNVRLRKSAMRTRHLSAVRSLSLEIRVFFNAR